MFTDLNKELSKFKARQMNWNRIAEHAKQGTHSKPGFNKHGKRNKARLVQSSDHKILTWVSPNAMPKKVSRAKHRTRTILADVLHKTKQI